MRIMLACPRFKIFEIIHLLKLRLETGAPPSPPPVTPSIVATTFRWNYCLTHARLRGECMDYLYTVLNFLYVAAAVVFLFGAAVFVHEWGHFFVARKCGMKVEAFAIGFGPKIVSWVKDGIEYSWRWIPAGGFVKLPQMITSETIEGSNKADTIPPDPPLSRIL